MFSHTRTEEIIQYASTHKEKEIGKSVPKDYFNFTIFLDSSSRFQTDFRQLTPCYHKWLKRRSALSWRKSCNIPNEPLCSRSRRLRRQIYISLTEGHLLGKLRDVGDGVTERDGLRREGTSAGHKSM